MSRQAAIAGLKFYFAGTLQVFENFVRSMVSPFPVEPTGNAILLQAIARRPAPVLTYFCPIDQMKDCTSIRSRGIMPSSSRLVRMWL